MTSGTEYISTFYKVRGKAVGNVKHCLGDRVKYHWMEGDCDLCAGADRLSRAQQEFSLVEQRFWEEET